MHRDEDQAISGWAHEQFVAAADQGATQRWSAYVRVYFSRENDHYRVVPFSRLPRMVP